MVLCLEDAVTILSKWKESTTVSALSVFFPSNEVFVFYELREPSLKSRRSWLEYDLNELSARRGRFL
jgi:hypothetical protein